MKRYSLAIAAALVAALVAAGGALAGPGDGRVHSLIPSFVPRPDAWLQALVKLPHDPAPKRQPRPQPQLTTTTLSVYEHSAQPWILADQGCSAAHGGETGDRRPRLRQAGVRARRVRDDPVLGPLRAEPQDHVRGARVRARLRVVPAGGLHRVDRDRARHEQLPPVGAERLRGRRALGPRDEQAPAHARPEGAGGPRRGRRGGRRRARLGSRLPQDAAVLPRLPRGGARSHALRLRLARRRSRRDLERAAGVVRRRRAPPHEGAARDLQLRDGAGVGGPGPDRARATTAPSASPAS